MSHPSTRRHAVAVLAFCAAMFAGLFVATQAISAPTTTLVAPASCSAPAGTLTITICGNKWVNGNGQTVVLRGANTEGTQYDCAQSGAGFYDDTTVTPGHYSTEIAAMKAWGINVVRVNLNEECWLGINGVPKTTSAEVANGYDAYANEMGAYVSALNAAGIYAEVDLHLNAPGSELISDAGSADGQNSLPESHSDTFWKSVGTFFASNHAVIFGVFNEPFPPNYTGNGDTAAEWNVTVKTGGPVQDCTTANGGSNNPKCSTTTYAGESMSQMINDIRSVDKTTPLLAGGPDFAGDMDDWLNEYYPGGVSIDPDNLLAASVHIYFPGDSPCAVTTNVANSCPSSGVSGGNGSDAIALTATQTPVLIDEIGDFGCSASSLIPFLASIDSLNASGATDIGWVGWSWTTAGCDPTLISSFTTGKPAAMGVPFYCDLFSEGLNNGSLASCPGKPPPTTTTTLKPPPTTTTTVRPPPTTTTTTVRPPPTTTTTVRTPPTTTTTTPVKKCTRKHHCKRGHR